MSESEVEEYYQEWLENADVRENDDVRTAVAACLKFADAWRLLVEPSCGATLAALDVHADVFARFESILVEICGGIGVSVDQLAAWQTRFFPGGDAA